MVPPINSAFLAVGGCGQPGTAGQHCQGSLLWPLGGAEPGQGVQGGTWSPGGPGM